MTVALVCESCKSDPTFKGGYLTAAEIPEMVVNWLADHITHGVDVVDPTSNSAGPEIQRRLTNVQLGVNGS